MPQIERNEVGMPVIRIRVEAPAMPRFNFRLEIERAAHEDAKSRVLAIFENELKQKMQAAGLHPDQKALRIFELPSSLQGPVFEYEFPVYRFIDDE